MEEPKVHRGAREHAVGPGVVQRDNGLRPVLGDDRAEAGVDGVERGNYRVVGYMKAAEFAKLSSEAIAATK